VLRDQGSRPKEVDAASTTRRITFGALLERSNSFAVNTKDREELVPKRLRLGIFLGLACPSCRERRGI